MKPILACPPKDDRFYQLAGVTRFKPPPDAQEVNCTMCGQVCFIGPRQRAVREKTDAEVVCFVCLTKKLGPKAADSVTSLGGVGGTYEIPENN